MVFPVVMYGCESWTIKKAEHRSTDAFELWCCRSLLGVPWMARRSSESILKEISPEYSLEGQMVKLKIQNFGHLMLRACCCCCCCWVASVVSDSVWPHRQQPTRLLSLWDSSGKNTGVGCHFLLQCMKVKSEREVAQWCLTLNDPMDCSLPGSSVCGILQARVLEWGAITFSKGWCHLHSYW